MAPFAGQDYPGSYAALRARLNEDWTCLDYLDWSRWLRPPGVSGLAPDQWEGRHLGYLSAP